MPLSSTDIPDVLIYEPKVYTDARGFFLESWNPRELAREGLDIDFVQDNHSGSVRGVLRGLHYQLRRPQGKLVRVVVGEVFDVAVDLRRSSPTFGRWVGVRLSAENRRQLWVPPGFAHGFYVVSEWAETLYKMTDVYDPDDQHTLRWDDREVAVAWPLQGEPVLSHKDRDGVALIDAAVFP